MKIEEKAWFEIINNKKIFCILAEPEVDQRIVIMSHGFRGSNVGPSRVFVDFGKLLTKNGFSVLRFDQPNCGNSEGNFLDSSFREWVETITYLGNRYTEQGYEVILLGQSMGATATMIATDQPEIKNKINKIILWVPDPKTDFEGDPNKIVEEGGQIHKNKFWKEAKDMDFFGCMNRYTGKIHLVYGENDKYVSRKDREEIMRRVKKRGGGIMVLSGQDHSSWEYEQSQRVFEEELKFLKD